MKRRNRRRAVGTRDRGVCASCGLDTVALRAELAAAGKYRWEVMQRYRYGPRDWGDGRTLWEADHIVPVIAGGSSEMDNMRTLCLPCHRDSTLRILSGPRAEMLARAVAEGR